MSPFRLLSRPITAAHSFAKAGTIFGRREKAHHLCTFLTCNPRMRRPIRYPILESQATLIGFAQRLRERASANPFVRVALHEFTPNEPEGEVPW
jgi:hypothetical protein